MSEESTSQGLPSASPERKRGYYSSALTGDLLLYYEEALPVDGLEDEIAMLRGVIKFMIVNNPFNINVVISAFNCLKGLIRTQKAAFKQDNIAQLERAFRNVFKDAPLPRGFVLTS